MMVQTQQAVVSAAPVEISDEVEDILEEETKQKIKDHNEKSAQKKEEVVSCFIVGCCVRNGSAFVCDMHKKGCKGHLSVWVARGIGLRWVG